MQFRRPQNFATAFFLQKSAEFALLGLCLAATAYFVGRTPDAYEWAIPSQPSLVTSLLAGFQTAALFFLFTLYPLVTLFVVWTYRRLNGLALPIFSALLSLAYVLLWLSIMPGGVGHVFPGFWITTAGMVAFIWASSVALYPARPTRMLPEVSTAK